MERKIFKKDPSKTNMACYTTTEGCKEIFIKFKLDKEDVKKFKYVLEHEAKFKNLVLYYDDELTVVRYYEEELKSDLDKLQNMINDYKTPNTLRFTC